MRYIASLFIGLLLYLLTGCSTMLSAEPVTARVVDADTGKPLAGVAVMAYWELHNGSLTGHSFGCGAVDVEGSVTDQEGQFHIPGWGPVSIFGSCGMREASPSMILFKSGYYAHGVNNNPLDPLGTVSVSRSRWNGKTIQLRVVKDMDLEAKGAFSYADDFSSLNDSLGRFVFSDCNWKKIPDMLRAIYIQEEGFSAAGQKFGTITSKLIEDDAAIQEAAPECGSPKAFIEGLVK